MPITRKFLNWNTPVVDAVTQYLSADHTKGPLDLSDTLIIVPTGQAGRRLREHLAERAEKHNSAVLGAKICNPSFIFKPENRPTATDTDIAAAWLEILSSIKPSEIEPLCPNGLDKNNTDELLALADNINTIRQDLSDNLHTIRGVLSEHSDVLSEPDRWNVLAELEKHLLKSLKKKNLDDPITAKMDETQNPSLSEEFRRILVCCVPGISGIAAKTLESLSARRDVVILIHAPESIHDCFDSYGRPIPEKWKNRAINLPDWKNNLFIETSPVSQAIRVMTIINSDVKRFGPLDTAIGVPDHNAVACVQDEFEKNGVKTYDPQEININEVSVFSLILHLIALYEHDDYHNLARVLRHPDFLSFLATEKDFSIPGMLMELDLFYNEYLPCSLKTTLDHLHYLKEKNKDKFRYENLLPATTRLDEYLKILKEEYGQQPADGWLKVLSEIYKYKELSDNAFDSSFAEAAEKTGEVLTELAPYQKSLNTREFNRVLINRLKSKTITRNRENAIMDLDGWLELHWNNAPFMIITGMNEDFVPGVKVNDPFMPNTLRKHLELNNDDTIFARDTYLLSAIIESRRENGKTCLLAGKFSSDGTPLKPSRLLFKCEDKYLVDIAGHLFSKPTELISKPPSAIPFRFRIDKLEAAEDNIFRKKRISVTAFRDYLACPFRFYLKHIVKMEKMDDMEMGIDTRLFGTLIHEILQKMGKDQSLNACTDEKVLYKGLLNIADKEFFKHFGKELAGFTIIARESAMERLRMVARIQTELTETGWKILSDELETKHHLELNGFTVSGKIDRIDYNRNTGTLRVLDYKTGSTNKDSFLQHAKKAKADEKEDYRFFTLNEKHYLWQDLQLPLYHHMISRSELINRFKIDHIEMGHFVVPKKTSETGIVSWNDNNSEIIDNAMKCAGKIIDKIKSKEFWPPAEKVEYDDYKDLFTDGPEAFDVPTKGFHT